MNPPVIEADDPVQLARFVRASCLETAHRSGTGHSGADLSAADILSVLYATVLNVDAEAPLDADRDRFILSKSHASAAMYSVLSARGFLSRDELWTFGQGGSRLCTVTSARVPGIEFSTGSLGHGLSLGVGAAIAAKLDGSARRTFVLTGDGELQEGSNWEAAMLAASRGLDNLVAIVDRNRAQKGASTEDINALEPLADKWRSFGWAVVEIDGHDIEQLVSTFAAVPFERGRPSCVIAETVKGRGVSFMEHGLEWHSKQLTADQLQMALAEIWEDHQ